MATTFNNGESLASIRAKLNANAGEINGKANLSGATFTGDIYIEDANLWQYFSSGTGIINIGNGSAVSGWRRAYITHDLTNLIIANQENGSLGFDTNNIRRVTIQNNGDLTVNGQNWTSAWTSYTPVVTGSGGGSGSGVSANGRYKLYGKTCHFEIRVSMSGIGSLSGSVIIGLPFTSSSSLLNEVPVQGFMCLFNENPQTQSRGMPIIVGNSNNIQFLLGVDATAQTWTTGAWIIRVRGTYEIA